MAGCSLLPEHSGEGFISFCDGTAAHGKWQGQPCKKGWANTKRDTGRLDNADSWCRAVSGCTLADGSSTLLQYKGSQYRKADAYTHPPGLIKNG